MLLHMHPEHETNCPALLCCHARQSLFLCVHCHRNNSKQGSCFQSRLSASRQNVFGLSLQQNKKVYIGKITIFARGNLNCNMYLYHKIIIDKSLGIVVSLLLQRHSCQM